MLILLPVIELGIKISPTGTCFVGISPVPIETTIPIFSFSVSNPFKNYQIENILIDLLYIKYTLASNPLLCE